MRLINIKSNIFRATAVACLVTIGLILPARADDGEATAASKVKPQAKACRNESLSGNYGYVGHGTFVGIGPAATSGVVTFDGEGNLSGRDIANLNGVISPRTFSGSYTVNADCTGSATINDSLGQTINVNFVLLDKGREVYVIETDPGIVFVATAKKQ